jgi:tetratricopeptide (TPR) repeat protein
MTAIPPLVKLLQQTSAQLRQEDIDAGLATVIREVESATAPAEALERAGNLLPLRARALEAAHVGYIARMVPFTPAGWAERAAALERQLRHDPRGGTAAWLAEWLAAAAYCRITAMERIVATPSLPRGAELLTERCALAGRALDDREWHVAEPLLAAGVDGVPTPDSGTLPPAGVRGALLRLLVRLALREGRWDAADAALDTLEADFPSPAVQALRARWLHWNGESDAGYRLLDEAALREPAGLDVTHALIERAHAESRSEAALEAATAAIDELPVLADVQAEIERLVDPPAELWVAAAHRADRDHDDEILELALKRADEAIDPGDAPLGARVAGLMAARADRLGRPAAERAAAHLTAGSESVRAQRLADAARHYEIASGLAPDDWDAKIRLADTLVALGQGDPLAGARKDIERALGIIGAARAAGAITLDRSWAHLTEAQAHARLAEAVDGSDNAHAWSAFVAVCRSLVHVPEDPDRWSALAWAADGLSLYGVELAAIERARDLGAADDIAQAQYLQALANVGRVDEALALAEGSDEDWYRAVRGWLLAHSGNLWKAASVLRSTTRDPSWVWASSALITALLATDRYDDAADVAVELRATWTNRLDEHKALWALAMSSLVLGDLDDAEGWIAQLARTDDEGEAPYLTGVLRALRGDTDGALAALRDNLASIRYFTELQSWPDTAGVTLAVLCARHEAPVPPLESLRDALDERRATLQARLDPLEDLLHAPVRAADADTVALARALGAALLRDAAGEREQARDALRALAEPLLADPEVAALRDALAAPRTVAAPAPADGNGRPSELLPAAPAEEPSERPLMVQLPSSWFADHENPVEDHPLFLRYIPEMRMRASWSVPPIRVKAEDDLEPDRFRILVYGDAVDEGHVPAEYAYGSGDAFALLGIGAAEAVAGLRLSRVPRPALEPAGALGELLTMPAVEVVARRIGEVADAHAGRLGGPAPNLWRRLTSSVKQFLGTPRDEPAAG